MLLHVSEYVLYDLIKFLEIWLDEYRNYFLDFLMKSSLQKFFNHKYARFKIRVINGNTNYISLPINVNNSILEKVATHLFIGCKLYAKNVIIESYQDACTVRIFSCFNVLLSLLC